MIAKCLRANGIESGKHGQTVVFAHLVEIAQRGGALLKGKITTPALRRMQLGIGAVILIGADMGLAAGNTIWWTALGAAF